MCIQIRKITTELVGFRKKRMSQKSSLYRTIEILKDLNAGKKLCVTNLAIAYEVSDRTIRRDFELIRELFGDFMSKEG